MERQTTTPRRVAVLLVPFSISISMSKAMTMFPVGRSRQGSTMSPPSSAPSGPSNGGWDTTADRGRDCEICVIGGIADEMLMGLVGGEGDPSRETHGEPAHALQLQPRAMGCS